MSIAAAALLAIPSAAVDTATVAPAAAPTTIVIGFVGGFIGENSSHHGTVIIAQQIRRTAPQGTFVQVFENRRRKRARETVLRLLDADHDGVLSPREKRNARIILYGHSWGGAAAVLLARDLQREGVPLLLTVQIDSVAKFWQSDSVIPENVQRAVNFYQTHGLLHGQRHITAADPAKTEILGNYRMDYRKAPVACAGAARWERLLTPGHMQSECDPQVWWRIENLVTREIESAASAQRISEAQPPSR